MRLHLLSKSNIVVVSTEDNNFRDAKCLRVCSGTGAAGKTSWNNFSSDGVYTDTDISKCGFVATPTITTSMAGGSHWDTTGSSEVYNVSPKSFRTYIKNVRGQNGGANRLNWRLEWVAVGYVC